MKTAFAIALASGLGLASATNAQTIEVVPDQAVVDVSGGAVDVMFSLYLDNDGLPAFDLGPAGIKAFFGWSSFSGTFGATAGEFQAMAEGPTDTSLGSWMGRRPGSVMGLDGSMGSFRFANLASFGSQLVSNGGLTLGSMVGPLSGGQKQTVLGGTGQNNSGRIEVFRGMIRFDDTDLGEQQIDFVGTAGFFTDPSFLTTASSAFETSAGSVRVIPAPGVVALIGAGAIAIGRRRR